MMVCSYSNYVLVQLKAIHVRLQEKTVKHDDLYFLKNIGALLKCEWEDWFSGASKSRLSERGKVHQETLRELEMLLPGIIVHVDKHLTTESVLPEVVEISTPSVVQPTSKLEEARNDAQILEQNLAGIISVQF